MDLIYRPRWIRSVYLADLQPDQLFYPCWRGARRRRGGGACQDNILIPTVVPAAVGKEVNVRMALLNVRSLSQKTFILHDFYKSHDLQFMFLTEIRMREGELAPLTELRPPNTSFLNTPRLTGRAGGVASVYSDAFKCKQIFQDTPFTSFELQLFTMDKPCAPKYNENFSSSLQIFYLDLSHFMTTF